MKMDGIIAFLPVLIVALLLLYMVYGLLMLLTGYFKKLSDKITLRTAGRKSLNRFAAYEKYLLNRFPYYDRLTDHLKVKFLLRVRNFIASKNFSGREGLVVTEEIKTWVAASAVQLTFGLSKYSLSRFSKIIIYPEAYYNKSNDAMHMGEAHPAGVLVLSWKDLQEGYSSPKDNFNVGLHEMAHALELQLLLKDDYDVFFANYYHKWSMATREEFENAESERASFFRKYAGTNRREFFAVCIEYFFESGEEFREKLPQIYYHFCILLNQDPLHDDKHVEEKTRKNVLELEIAIDAQQPLFTPEYEPWTLGSNFLLFAVLILLFTVPEFETSVVIAILTAFAIIGAISIYIRMDKIILYEKYLVIRNPVGKVKMIFELDDIVGVTFHNEDTADSIEVFRAQNGRIIRNKYYHLSGSGNMELLKRRLRERHIPVR